MPSFEHTGGCNIYCSGTVHAIIILTTAPSSSEEIKMHVEARGYTFISARLAPETNLQDRCDDVGSVTTEENGTIVAYPTKKVTPEEIAEAWLVVIETETNS
jgi:hypothetical protein